MDRHGNGITKYLSSRFPIMFLQESWLYRYQTSILTDIFDNTEFACGCVDDDALVPPSLHMRGYGGTCILWHSSLNSLIKKLPETSVRINVVELKCPMALFCLFNVCLPARGVAENEILFEESLDELKSSLNTVLLIRLFLVVTSTLPYIEETICVETCYSRNL